MIVIQDVAERAIRRETHDVGEAIHKYMGRRDSGQLLIWLDDFYREHALWMERQYHPVMQAYGQLVADAVTDELGRSVEDVQEIVERFTAAYTASFSAAQTGVSIYRIKECLTAAAQQGLDIETALTDEMSSWKDNRPAEIAREQSTRAGNAMAKTLYAAAGVATLHWVTMGAPCPYCHAMDGRSVNISKNFLSAGESLTVEGSEPLKVVSNTGHPPLHKGCECMITAG